MLLNPHCVCSLQRRHKGSWARQRCPSSTGAAILSSHAGTVWTLCWPVPSGNQIWPSCLWSPVFQWLYPLCMLPHGSSALVTQCRLSSTGCISFACPIEHGFSASQSRKPITGLAPSLLLPDPLPTSPILPWYCLVLTREVTFFCKLGWEIQRQGPC